MFRRIRLAPLALAAALAGCGTQAAQPPAPKADRPAPSPAEPTPAAEPPADPDARMQRAYATGLDAVASAVEAALAEVEPSEIETFEQGQAILARATPGAHMDALGAAIDEAGVERTELAAWMEAQREQVDALSAQMEARLAAQQPKLRAVLERVAELAPPDRAEAIRARLATLDTVAPSGEAADPMRGEAEAGAWTPVEDEAGLRDAAARAGATRGVVIDVSAAWCLPCRELESKTFADPVVLAALADFETVRVDATDPGPAVSNLLSRLQATSLPNVLVFASGDVLAEALALPKPIDPTARITAFVDAERLRRTLAQSHP